MLSIFFNVFFSKKPSPPTNQNKHKKQNLKSKTKILVAALRGVAIQRGTRLTRAANTLAATAFHTRHSSPLTTAATLHGYAASQ